MRASHTTSSRIHISYRISSIHGTLTVALKPRNGLNPSRYGVPRFGSQIAVIRSYRYTWDHYATRNIGFLPSHQEQGLPFDRCSRGWRKKRSRGSGVDSALVGADSSRGQAHRSEISADGARAF